MLHDRLLEINGENMMTIDIKILTHENVNILHSIDPDVFDDEIDLPRAIDPPILLDWC